MQRSTIFIDFCIKYVFLWHGKKQKQTSRIRKR